MFAPLDLATIANGDGVARGLDRARAHRRVLRGRLGARSPRPPGDRRRARRSFASGSAASIGLLLPLAMLGLLLVALAVFRRWHAPFFLTIAIPLTVALAVIRLLVYAMREIFGAPAWVPVSERVISYAIWGIVLLHFTGVLPGLWEELDAMEIPLGSEAHLGVRAPEGRGRRDPHDRRDAVAVGPHRAAAAARLQDRQQRSRRRSARSCAPSCSSSAS